MSLFLLYLIGLLVQDVAHALRQILLAFIKNGGFFCGMFLDYVRGWGYIVMDIVLEV